MLSDDELKVLRTMIAAAVSEALEAHGFQKPPSAAALRMQRLRERQRNAASQSVTHSPEKRNGGVTKRNNGVTHEAPTNATWRAYAAAYQTRWGVAPMRNRTVNGQLAQFVTRIPTEEAPMVAAFFVQSNRGLYVAAKHPVNLLLRNAEALRTEWATGNAGTETEARQADRTQATGNAFAPLIAEAQERAKRGTH